MFAIAVLVLIIFCLIDFVVLTVVLKIPKDAAYLLATKITFEVIIVIAFLLMLLFYIYNI